MNTFEKLENQESTTTPVQESNEMSMDSFSDTAVGNKISYKRPDLTNTEEVIDKFVVFQPKTSDKVYTSQKGTSEYWSVQMELSFSSTNEDGIQNREFISGAKCFKRDDGSMGAINFWYAGGESQSCYLWELVAKAKGIEPKELSPREFVAFLNGKPKCKIVGIKYKNYNAPAGSPDKITKNMPGEFI